MFYRLNTDQTWSTNKLSVNEHRLYEDLQRSKFYAGGFYCATIFNTKTI